MEEKIGWTDIKKLWMNVDGVVVDEAILYQVCGFVKNKSSLICIIAIPAHSIKPGQKKKGKKKRRKYTQQRCVAKKLLDKSLPVNRRRIHTMHLVIEAE